MITAPASQPRGLFTVSQAAQYLGLATSTIRTYAYRGLIPYVKLEESKHAPLRFRHEDLEAFIDDHWFSKRY